MGSEEHREDQLFHAARSDGILSSREGAKLLLRPEELKSRNGPAKGSRSQKEVAAKRAEYGEDTVASAASGH